MADNKVKFLRGTAAKYEASTKDSDVFYYTTDTKKLYLGENEVTGIGKAGTGKNAEIFNTDNLASGNCSHAEGDSTIAAGIAAHAEGYSTSANKDYSHSEGYMAVASGTSSHAEGHKTRAMGDYSHAEGNHCSAHGVASHAGGSESVATGDNAFTHGDAVKANNNNEIAFGAFNASNADTLFSVGNGTSDTLRSNAFEITKTTGKLFDKEIATKEDIPTTLPANGGNADTLGDKSVSEFLQNIGGLTSGSLLEYALTLPTSGWLVAGPKVTDTPNLGGTFFVEVRNYNGYLELVACQTGANTVSVNNYNRVSWFGWHNVSDNGNAASVGAYTEAKLAALEARIAALEEGT